ncbi:MAG: phosphotransferase [Nocardioides sp.]
MDLIARGREADVFALDADRVLRRFHDGRSAAPEHAMLTALAGLGYPVPEVAHVDGADLVMERVDGPTMAQALMTGVLDGEAGARMLAALHDDLHSLAWPAAAPGECLVHLDLHPENVLLRDGRPVVIDWTNTRSGPAGLDVAMTALILAQVAVGEPAVRSLVEPFVGAFLAFVSADPGTTLDRAVALRRTDPHQTPEELDQLDMAVALVVACGGPEPDVGQT